MSRREFVAKGKKNYINYVYKFSINVPLFNLKTVCFMGAVLLLCECILHHDLYNMKFMLKIKPQNKMLQTTSRRKNKKKNIYDLV